MSARSMIRAHDREAQRAQRRSARIKRAMGGATAAVGAAVAFASPAEAATFEVTNLDDSGPGSLRDAIADANLDATADTITFAPGLSGQIALTSGELVIDAALDIQGPGPGALTINGLGDNRIFSLDAGDVGEPRDVVSISGLKLRDGYNSGGGGAIYSYETDMRLTGMVLSGNYSQGTGGAIDIESSPVSISDSRLTGNEGSGGGAMYTDGVNAETNSQDTVTITDSVISNNYANGNGGALYFDNATGGDILITRSELSDNTSTGTGGAILFYGHKGSQTIRETTISGNASESGGGGIYFDSDYADPDGLLIENSTISGNFADGEGGGLYVDNTADKPVRILNSTIVRNSSTGAGGGIFRDDFDVTLSSTIVAGNDDTGGTQDDLAQDAAATEQFTIGHSLIEGGLAGLTVTPDPSGSNLTGVDPELGPLTDNGGPTPTHLPSLASPAIDAGIANGLTTDQRGLPRTVDQPDVADAAGSDGTDIGSVERAAPVIPPTDTVVEGATLIAKKTQKQKGKKIKVKLEVGADEAVDVTASGKIKADGEKYELKTANASVDAGQTDTVILKPAKKAAKKIANVLAEGGKAKAKLMALFTDGPGNEATEKAKVKLKKK